MEKIINVSLYFSLQAVVSCLESKDYTQIRNTLILLTKVEHLVLSLLKFIRVFHALPVLPATRPSMHCFLKFPRLSLLYAQNTPASFKNYSYTLQ